MIHRRALRRASACLASLLAVACSGGGAGGTSPAASSFQVASLSVANGSVWQINREIVVGFTRPVDFSTVSSNTIHLRTLADVPATGTFSLRDPYTVVFQPSCPTRDDLSDAGLQPNGVSYVLRVAGLDSSANTVRALDGAALGHQQVRTFSTPASTQVSVAFQDTAPGPPVPVVRAQGSTDSAATYLEVGHDPDRRVYFEQDATQLLVLSDPTFEAPLNLYSDELTRVAVVLALNQPVNPAASNLTNDRLRLEFRDPNGGWHPLQTRVTLEANCTETGARVRLEPIGPLPGSSALRAVLRAGFQDLVGEASLQSLSSFAQAPTRAVHYASLAPPDLASDELNDGFDFAHPSPLSFEDETLLSDSPLAEWGAGRLSAAFSFQGSGGPNGEFDWVVRTGELLVFDTTSTLLIGGPGGVPTSSQTAVNGVVDVHDLVIQAGGKIRVQGPNPMRISATGQVRIDGVLDLSGFAGKDVLGLGTTNLMEQGGAGAAGGGKGGNSNEITTAPTTRGGRGSGPFRAAGLGGEGGEMGVSASNDKNQRRPGGGGGGRFAGDVLGTSTPPGLSLVASRGNDGHPNSRGAESGVLPSRGGASGPGPFVDASPANDFFGVFPVASGGEVRELIRGELSGLSAGYGGGGGGNASNLYPQPVWNSMGDEKGGPGGGAAGGLHIQALGPIVFGAAGAILANGATGGAGEHLFLEHIGGTGGGGSGGHVILESASFVDFTGGGDAGLAARETIQAGGPPLKTGSLQFVDPCCTSYSNGGAGGAGVIQIHVPDPVAPPDDDPLRTDILVPTDALALANPLDALTSPPAYVMVPTFGARSRARSKWISIGGADQKPDGTPGLVRFLFDGVESAAGPDAGKLRVDGARVAELAPLLTVSDLAASLVASLLADGFTLEIRGAGLLEIRSGTTSGVSNDAYLRTPALLEGCALRLALQGSPSSAEDFDVVGAEYDEGDATPGDERLRVRVGAERGPLTAFNPTGAAGTTLVQLIPRFFRVVTSDLPDFLPPTAFVRVRFQAAEDNGIGAPNEANPLVDWTADIRAFNALPPGALQFFRYEVEFDLDATSQGVTKDTEPVALDFLKIPFVF